MPPNGEIKVTSSYLNHEIHPTNFSFSDLDDESLISLIVQKNSDALSVLYDRFSGLVFTLALNILGDQGRAEEITLDVFTRVWEKAQTYRPGHSKVASWLAGITRNRSIDIIRQRNSPLKQLSITWATNSSGNQLMINGPEAATELALQQERVRLAVAQLPKNQQEALALAYFRGYSHSEIAKVLDQPLGTIKTRIRLAMQKLREILQDERIGT